MTTRISVLASRIAIATLLLAWTSGCDSQSSADSAPAGYRSDVSEVQVISAVVGGKNIFIPSTIVVVAGKPQTLSVFNTADKPHGFAIRGLSIEAVLMPGEETKIELPALQGSEIYTIGCQLHPPHRTATLVVVPAR
jgi:heme/copper-type cytochrome/quinol oxidase subunit 2